MEERERPYLGRYSFPNGEYYVVFFSRNEKENGIIVNSTVKNNPDLQFGNIGNFDESQFEYLDRSIRIIINND